MKQVSTIFLVKDPPIDRLAALIEYLRFVSDEFIIVVDDRTDAATVSIMEGWHDVTIVPFAWYDNFAAARNAALPHVTRAWTLHVDPDELPSVKMMQHIDTVTKSTEDLPVAYIYHTLNFWAGVLGEEMGYHWHVRLWRSGHGRFFRKVHELVGLNGVDDEARGRLSISAPTDAYLIHSKPLDAITASDSLYAKLGEVSR